jgi:thioredoxin-like negative regulator of GroEL
MTADATLAPCRAESPADFAAAVQGGDSDHLVVFGASWCRPAQRIEAHAQQLARRHRLGLLAVDVEACPEIVRLYGVAAVPTLLLFRNGQLAGRRVGELSERAIEDWILT